MPMNNRRGNSLPGRRGVKGMSAGLQGHWIVSIPAPFFAGPGTRTPALPDRTIPASMGPDARPASRTRPGPFSLALNHEDLHAGSHDRS